MPPARAAGVFTGFPWTSLAWVVWEDSGRMGRTGEKEEAVVTGDKANQPCEFSAKWPLDTSPIGPGVVGEVLEIPRL